MADVEEVVLDCGIPDDQEDGGEDDDCWVKVVATEERERGLRACGACNGMCRWMILMLC